MLLVRNTPLLLLLLISGCGFKSDLRLPPPTNIPDVPTRTLPELPGPAQNQPEGVPVAIPPLDEQQTDKKKK